MTLGNRLLGALPEEAIEELGSELELITLSIKQPLYQPHTPIADVFFLRSGVASLVSEPTRGETVEIATIGREGMVGIPVFLGDTITPSRAFIQVPGEGYRLSTEAFRRTVEKHAAFRTILMRYTLALLGQVSQSTACNRVHEVQERCARWLLQTHDRVQGDSFSLTQEFLAQMLGVHRPTVSVAAGMLQKAGLITYVRGIITVRDREGLEAASCECYRIIAAEYERLLGPFEFKFDRAAK